MKKAIIFISAVVMILSFAACSSQATQEIPAQPTEAASPTLAPTAQPTAAPTPTPTPRPSPTPELMLSPEEIAEQQAMEEAEQLRYYNETYGDRYALFLIKDLVDEGLVSEDLLKELAPEFINIGPEEHFSEDSYLETKRHYEDFEKILNGRLEDFNDVVYNQAFHFLYSDVQDHGIVYISAFDTQESRDRVENGIIILEDYFQNPNQDNLNRVRALLFSEELLPGELIVLFIWFWESPNHLEEIEFNGRVYSIVDFTATIDPDYNGYLAEVEYLANIDLIELNSTPNPDDYVPKDWVTEEDIMAAIEAAGQ